MSNTQKKFWFVWCAERLPPNHKHDSLQSAETEAERLAKFNRSQTFVVLEAISAYKIDNLVRIDFDQDSEIPF